MKHDLHNNRATLLSATGDVVDEQRFRIIVVVAIHPEDLAVVFWMPVIVVLLTPCRPVVAAVTQVTSVVHPFIGYKVMYSGGYFPRLKQM